MSDQGLSLFTNLGPPRRIRVSGRGVPFPIDLMRQEACLPYTKADSDKIQGTYGDRSTRARRWTIVLVTYAYRTNIGAWNNYGIEVMEQEVGVE
jgi:hypothetical protein